MRNESNEDSTHSGPPASDFVPHRESGGRSEESKAAVSAVVRVRPQQSPREADVQTPTDQVYTCLQQAVDAEKEVYLRMLIRPALHLPRAVVTEVQSETQNELDLAVNKFLDGSALAPGSPRRARHRHVRECSESPGACTLMELEGVFHDVLMRCHAQGHIDATSKNDLRVLGREIVGCAEVRQAIEPLVTLLVTYATERLQS
jgi:hypothetical protein